MQPEASPNEYHLMLPKVVLLQMLSIVLAVALQYLAQTSWRWLVNMAPAPWACPAELLSWMLVELLVVVLMLMPLILLEVLQVMTMLMLAFLAVDLQKKGAPTFRNGFSHWFVQPTLATM